MHDAQYTPTANESVILQLVDSARLAPSSHNTQPWLVHIEDERNFTIGYDPARQLRVGDPELRELFMSLGCFVESTVRLAEDRGLAIDATVVGSDQDHIVRMTIVGNPTEDTKEWGELIRRRRSDRRPHLSKEITPDAKSTIGSLEQGHAKVGIFQGAEEIAFLSKATFDATLFFMEQPAFRAELSGWVRNNWTKRHDGMPAFTQGIPGPVSLIAPFVIKYLRQTARDQANKDSLRVKQSAAICVIHTDDTTHQGWIDAGRLYQSLCLHATRLDLSTSAVSAAVIAADTSAAIKTKCGIAGNPVALLRLGYVAAGELPATPRRTADEIIRV